MNFSVEAECGYIPTEKRMEGTSVEYVLARPGGKFNFNNYIRALIPESSCEFLGF